MDRLGMKSCPQTVFIRLFANTSLPDGASPTMTAAGIWFMTASNRARSNCTSFSKRSRWRASSTCVVTSVLVPNHRKMRPSAFRIGTARDGEPQQAPALVLHARDGGACPEPGPVLANAPALLLEPAGGGGGAQLLLGVPTRQVLGREQPGEVRSDDLAVIVPVQALGARVPGQDRAGRVDGEDGVVANG
jgi:hypothetical protein